MSVFWGKILWCDDCDEIMDWERYSETWTCPACGQQVTDLDTPDYE